MKRKTCARPLRNSKKWKISIFLKSEEKQVASRIRFKNVGDLAVGNNVVLLRYVYQFEVKCKTLLFVQKPQMTLQPML